MRVNNDGQMTLDFLLGLVVFLLAVLYLVTAIPGIFLPYQNNAVDLSSVVYRTSSLLVEDPGFYIQKNTSNGFEGWERSQANINNLSRIGLASSKLAPDVISRDKIRALEHNVTYNTSRDMLGLNNTVPYDYSLTINWTDSKGTKYSMTKPNASETSLPVGNNVETIQRMVFVDEGSGILINTAEYYNNTTDNLVEWIVFNVTRNQTKGDVVISILNSTGNGNIREILLFNFSVADGGIPLDIANDYDVYINGTKWTNYGLKPFVPPNSDVKIVINVTRLTLFMGSYDEASVFIWASGMQCFRKSWNDKFYTYDESNPRFWSVYNKGILKLKVWS